MTNSVVTMKLTLVSCGFEVPRPGKPLVRDKPGHLVAIETAVSQLSWVLDLRAAPLCSWSAHLGGCGVSPTQPFLPGSFSQAGSREGRASVDGRLWKDACGLPGRVRTLCHRPAGPMQGGTVHPFPYLRAVGIYPSYASRL